MEQTSKPIASTARSYEPETRNPKPETRSPKPETRNPKPEQRTRLKSPHAPNKRSIAPQKPPPPDILRLRRPVQRRPAPDPRLDPAARHRHRPPAPLAGQTGKTNGQGTRIRPRPLAPPHHRHPKNRRQTPRLPLPGPLDHPVQLAEPHRPSQHPKDRHHRHLQNPEIPLLGRKRQQNPRRHPRKRPEIHKNHRNLTQPTLKAPRASRPKPETRPPTKPPSPPRSHPCWRWNKTPLVGASPAGDGTKRPRRSQPCWRWNKTPP